MQPSTPWRSRGIRAAFFSGSPKPGSGQRRKAVWEIPHPRERLEQASEAAHEWACKPWGGDSGSALFDAGGDAARFRMARELGLIASMHVGGGSARCTKDWARLERSKLLGEHVNIVHGNSLTDDQLSRFCSLGVSFTVAPAVE